MAFISSMSAVNLLLIHREHITGKMLMLSEDKIKFVFAISKPLLFYLRFIILQHFDSPSHFNLLHEKKLHFFMHTKMLVLIN